jgi:hypothetical protein
MELLTFPEHLSSFQVSSTVCVAQYLASCEVWIIGFCFVFFILAIDLSVLFRLAVSGYPINNFCSFTKKSVKGCVQHGILFTILTSYIL